MSEGQAASTEDYPKTLAELEARFATEDACRAYLRALRWPDGFRCPRCSGQASWPTGRDDLVECATCHHQTTSIAGTVFEGSRKPLVTWFRAMWWLTSQKNGASALGLKRVLGLGSYQTAWAWLHKLRRAMVRPDRERLCGVVEVDETYVGGTEPGKRGRPKSTSKKSLVLIAVELLEPKGFGRVRLRRVADASTDSLVGFIRDVVQPGATIHTDGWRPYESVTDYDYGHFAVSLRKTGQAAHIVLPGAHRVASLLKRWLLGTLQGAVSAEHLDYYLDEFTFRFNRRTSKSRGKLFYRLMQQAAATRVVPYRSIVGGTGAARPQDVVVT